MSRKSLGMAAAFALLALVLGGIAIAQQSGMSFFLTSAGSGKGADLGGLAGADRHCQSLAAAAGAGAAMVGHHDRIGLRADEPGYRGDPASGRSWNSSHLSNGCSQDDLKSTSGIGLFYCFAAD